MADLLRVRNWDRWQYRSDRPQPWIKVYRDLLLDPDFLRLTDVQKAHLIMIFLAASAKNGHIDHDNDHVQRVIGSEKTPDLDVFLELQWLEKVGKRRRPRSRDQGAPRREEKNRSDQIREDPPIVPPESDHVHRVGGFGHFWHLYPRKTAKVRAEKAWRNLKPADRQAATLSLETYQFDPDLHFVPHASTWLNQRRWEDEPLPPRNANGRYETANDRIQKLKHDARAALAREAAGGDGVDLGADGDELRQFELGPPVPGERD